MLTVNVGGKQYRLNEGANEELLMKFSSEPNVLIAYNVIVPIL